MIRELTLPLARDEAASLRAGDLVTLTGPVYTARDAAHKRLIALMEEGKELPLPILNQTLYYVGPSPAPPGLPIGSAGPTTSYRMDSYTPALLDAGLVGMIGKGARSPAVVEAMIRNRAVYFGAIGGAAALLARSIQRAQVIAFPDLGTEAIRLLTLSRFPAIVLIDSLGSNLYKTGPAQYRSEEL